MEAIRKIAQAHQGLNKKLCRFSFPEAARLAAALSLLPSLHAQTLRIEILQHLIAVSCTGERIPERDDLAEWAGKYLADSPFARYEDPVEDVFVGSANSPLGGFRLLMGILTDADFLVEQLLIFLADKRNFPPIEAAISRVVPLLKLSDSLVDRLCHQRYCPGYGNRAGRIAVPRMRDLQPLLEALVFSSASLAQIGVDPVDLNDFVFKADHHNALLEENMWHSTLERRPLMVCEGGIMVVAPSSIGRAAIRFLIETMTQSMGGFAELFFEQQLASRFVNKVAHALEIRSIDFLEPQRPEAMPNLYPSFGQFDVGKPVILLTYCPPLQESVNNFAGHDTLTESEQRALDTHLRACAAAFESLPGFSGGMILISMAGVRPTSISVSRWDKRWHVHACSLADWIHLTTAGECTAIRLWKLSQQAEQLERNGTKLLNLAGLPNLYAAWKGSAFRILPHDKDTRGLRLLNLDCIFAGSFRLWARSRMDAHCLLSNDGTRWVRLTRYNATALFKEDQQMQMYTDPEILPERRLSGCVKDNGCVWWVNFSGEDVRSQRNTVFQLWECVFSWLARFARVALAERTSEWRGLTSLEIELQLPNLQNWQDPARAQSVPTASLSSAVDVAHRKIVLAVPEGFLNEFGAPKNIAERKIVEAIANTTAALALLSLTEARKEVIIHRTIPNDDARYFHVVRAQTTENLFADSTKPRPLKVTDEDFALSKVGVAHLAGYTSAERIRGIERCRDFLTKVVEKHWESIEAKLAGFERISVVSSCLHELDQLNRDEEHWDITTRSQFALRSDRENVHHVLAERRSERDKAKLCIRLLIETAQYACNEGHKLFTRDDQLSLLADLALLVLLAHHRDAIANGFINPEVQVFPNGEIEVDESFYAGAFSMYMTQRFRERTRLAADSYDDYFSDLASLKSPDAPNETRPPITDLDEAFIPEFGFSVSLLLKLVDEFRDLAMHSGQPIGILQEEHMLALLAAVGLSQSQSESFLARFTLPIRSARDKEFPVSCHKEDVFPWRFRRQLSLFIRPLPQVSVRPRAWVVSASTLANSVSYILAHIQRGRLPAAFFHSREMRTHIGNTVNRLGHDFAREVAALLRQLGLKTEEEVEMTKLGASKMDRLGDMDVIAWDVASGLVILIECKRLMVALTVREVIQQLEDFRGDRQGMDSLGRHLRRIDWLRGHRESLSKRTSIPVKTMRLVPLLVTSETVPMQFFTELDLCDSKVVPYDALDEFVATIWRPDRQANNFS